MKKILFVLPCFEFGGTVFSTLNMISILKKEYDIYVYPLASFGPVKDQYDKAILLPSDAFLDAVFTPGHLLGRKPKAVFYKVLYRIVLFLGIPIVPFVYKRVTAKLMRKHRFDYVASCQEGDTTEFVSFFQGVKRIAWFRSEYSVYRKHHTKRYEQRLHDIYSRIDSIVCVSQTTRDDFVRWFTECEEKAIAIHNIQNIERIIAKSKEPVPDPLDGWTDGRMDGWTENPKVRESENPKVRESDNPKVRQSENPFIIVSIGRISPQKRFSAIPSLAADLRERGLAFKWYIIGDGNIGGEGDRLREEQWKYNTSDVVFPIGSRLNPYPYLASANLFVITSSYEACPRVVAESIILGKPVVSADFSSAPEFVHNGVNGFVDKLYRLPEHIMKLANDRQLYNEMVAHCHSESIDVGGIYQKLIRLFN